MLWRTTLRSGNTGSGYRNIGACTGSGSGGHCQYTFLAYRTMFFQDIVRNSKQMTFHFIGVGYEITNKKS
jgi:hypothetical protein